MALLDWGSATNTGKVRRDNQDHVFADGSVFIVADGMGGANGGETAARIAVDAFTERVNQSELDSDAIQSALFYANEMVFTMGMANPDLHGMGTTFVSLVLEEIQGDKSPRKAYLLNVGDSRAYLLRKGEITQLTVDHSWVEEMMRAGRMSEDEVAHSRSRHVLTKVVGVDETVGPDLWEIHLDPGDQVILCSDGVTNELGDLEIAEILRRSKSAQDGASKVVEAAVLAGGVDNASAVVVALAPIGGESIRDLETHSQGVTASPLIRFAPHVVKIEGEGASLRGPMLQSIPIPISKSEFHKSGMYLRIAAFLILLLVILGVGAYGINSYVNGSYFVGASNTSNVVIYQGRPGGILWFKPKVVEVEKIKLNALPNSYVVQIKAGVAETSLSAARNYISNLTSQVRSYSATTSTLSSTTPTLVSGGG